MLKFVENPKTAF